MKVQAFCSRTGDIVTVTDPAAARSLQAALYEIAKVMALPPVLVQVQRETADAIRQLPAGV